MNKHEPSFISYLQKQVIRNSCQLEKRISHLHSITDWIPPSSLGSTLLLALIELICQCVNKQ